MGTTIIHRCAECSHKDRDHALQGGSHCSMGGCACILSDQTVRANNPPESIPTFPGYDQASGKWGASC